MSCKFTSSISAGRLLAWLTSPHGLAAGGEAGVARAIQILSSELRRTLALLGCSSLAEIKRDMVIAPR